MAINYTSLFENIGVHVAQFSRLSDIYTDIATYETAIETQYNANSTLHLLPGASSILESLRAQVEAFHFEIIGHVSNILTDKETVIDELPQLTSFSVDAVLAELFRDMVDNSVTVDDSVVTVGSVTKDMVNTNSGVLLTDKVLDGVSDPGDGFPSNVNYLDVVSQLGWPDDDVVIECVEDSVRTGGASEGAESWVITGFPQPTSRFSYQSVKGSGGATAIETGDGIDILTNGGMENWTDASTLSSSGWSVTDADDVVSRDGTDKYLGTYSLKVTGSGTADVFLTQSLINRVDIGRRYCIAFRYLGDASATAGTLKSYISGTGFTSEGTGEEIDLDDTDIAAATSWTTAHFFVNIPFDAPADLVLNIDIENLSSTHTVNIDSVVMVPVTYHAGIGYVILRGTEPFIAGDRFSLTNTNNDDGVFQAFFRDAYGIQLNSSSTPSIADSLGTP